MADKILSDAEMNGQSDGHHTCIVCFSDLGTNMRAKLPCGHDDICGVCHLRLRYLHDDTKCPICKQTNDTVIVDSDDTKPFDSYSRWGDEIGAGFVYKKDVGMFFEEKYYHDSIVPLYEYTCHKCDFKVDESIFVNQHLKNDDDGNKGGNKKKKKPRRLLVDHLRAKHRLQICQLCIDNKRDFISQLPRFTQGQLQNHMKKGDGPGSGFNGHPICEFCRPKRFYDVNFLYQHLHKEHYKCHICEKQGNDNQWFKSYGSLARHFEKQHFLCPHPQCLEARYVVFENEMDLKAHEISVHGGTSSGSTKINLEFNIRRANGSGDTHQNTPSEADFNYALDGQAFVPPALTNEGNNNNNRNTNSNIPNDESQLHPQHIQRTEELRAQAVAVREQQALNSQGESFPTLQAAAAPTPSSAPLVGWTSGTTLQNMNRPNGKIGQVTQEAFPTLQSNSSNKGKKKEAVKVNIGGARRQFAAMTTSANQQHQQASWGENNAAASVGSVSQSPSMNGSHSNNFFLATPTRQINRQADLAADNFPSLGGSSSSSTSASANAFARQNIQRRTINSSAPPSMNSANDFPSMQISSRSSANSSKTRAAKSNLKPPPMNSISDFPAPPSSQQSARSSARQQMLGGSDRKKSAENNFLQADMSPASAKATLEDMKVSLGQKNFKQLKQLTKTFALDQLSPEGYVDQTAELFENGCDNKDFWSFLPSLLESCPNHDSAQRALNYMNSLKRKQLQSNNTKALAPARATGPSSQWSGASVNASNVMRQVVPPPLPAPSTVPRSLTQPKIISSKKKSAWGASGNAKIVRTKASPGSVGVAAAANGPQRGTSTKYMAKQEKKERHAQNNNNNNQHQNKAKKKKQKNELRDLAFGK